MTTLILSLLWNAGIKRYHSTGVLTAGMDLPAHRTADRGLLAARPRFPSPSDYRSEWVFENYPAVV